jgi:general secretion pathway protein C
MNVNQMIINLDVNRNTILAITFLFIILVLGTIGCGLWQWHADWQLTHQKVLTVPAIAAADETGEMITAIPKKHLFGQSFTNGTVPLTNLQLKVTGIIKIEQELNGTISKALISISGRPSKIFQVGDSLPYGVKVYDITPVAVILQNDGRLEKLLLPRKKLQFKQKTSQEYL